MAYNGNNSNEGGSGNVWSSGSRGGSRGGYSRSYNDDDESGPRGGGGSYRGSFGNNNSRGRGSGGGGGGSYGFRRQNDGEVEILNDAIFIQNLPKNITRDEILAAFSTVGNIKIDDRSGGPKIWIYKDRDTGEPNGRATVTYDDDDTANKAISEYNDQHIDSIGAVVRVQLAQRRPRNNDNNDRGGGRGGYRGGRSNWDNNNSRQGFGSDSNRWGGSRGGGGGGSFGDNRSGGGFRGAGGGDSFRDDDDRGSRGGPYRGASRGNGGSSNYAPY